MENTIIKTGVNINLDQNDMVELMLEEQAEQREIKHSTVSTEIRDLVTEYAATKEELTKEILKVNDIKNTPEYKKFMAGVKVLGLELVSDTDVTYNHKTIGTLHTWDFNPFEDYHNPVTQLKKAISLWEEHLASKDKNHHCRSTPRALEIATEEPSYVNNKLEASSKDGSYVLKYLGDHAGDKKIKLNAKAKKLITNMEKLAKKELKLREERYNLELELFNLEHGGKRNKSRFIKSMLKNSDSGKSLVALMENIKGTNLLQIGTR